MFRTFRTPLEASMASDLGEDDHQDYPAAQGCLHLYILDHFDKTTTQYWWWYQSIEMNMDNRKSYSGIPNIDTLGLVFPPGLEIWQAAMKFMRQPLRYRTAKLPRKLPPEAGKTAKSGWTIVRKTHCLGLCLSHDKHGGPTKFPEFGFLLMEAHGGPIKAIRS